MWDLNELPSSMPSHGIQFTLCIFSVREPLTTQAKIWPHVLDIADHMTINTVGQVEELCLVRHFGLLPTDSL